MDDEYSAEQVFTARTRFMDVTHGTLADFLFWLGLGLLYRADLDDLISFRIGKHLARQHTIRKLDLLLSPHWYALLKADLARK